MSAYKHPRLHTHTQAPPFSMLADTCELNVWGQKVKLGLDVNIRLSPMLFVYTLCYPEPQLCFAHWDILGHGIDHGVVGMRGLKRSH